MSDPCLELAKVLAFQAPILHCGVASHSCQFPSVEQLSILHSCFIVLRMQQFTAYPSGPPLLPKQLSTDEKSRLFGVKLGLNPGRAQNLQIQCIHCWFKPSFAPVCSWNIVEALKSWVLALGDCPLSCLPSHLLSFPAQCSRLQLPHPVSTHHMASHLSASALCHTFAELKCC